MMGSTPKRTFIKHRHFGRCAWEGCFHDGQLVKGLCKKHYDTLHMQLARQGLIESQAQEPASVCKCIHPDPQNVITIFGSFLGSHQCGKCGRAIIHEG